MKNEQMTLNEDKTILGMLLAVLGSSVFATIISLLFSVIFTSLFAIVTDATGEALINKVNNFYEKYYIEYFITLLSMAILIFVFYLIMGKKRAKSILLSFKSKKVWFYSIIIGLGFVIISTLYSNLTNLITDSVVNANQSEVVNLIEGNYYLAFIYVVLMAPIVEEIGMRYFIFGGFKKQNKIIAYILGSSIFALLHFLILIGQTDINILSELLAIPTYFGAGLLLCFVYDKSERLSCPIIIHTINNLISFLFVVL